VHQYERLGGLGTEVGRERTCTGTGAAADTTLLLDYGLPEILTEDFLHDRLYGTVRVLNPFIGSREPSS